MPNVGIASSQITTKGSSGGGSSSSPNFLNVKNAPFNAVGSGKIDFAPSIASGTPNLTGTGLWQLTDVGKNIVVAGAGPNGTDLWTTISAFVSSSAVTLAANASSTVPSTPVQPNFTAWGAVDDTAAIQACINAAAAAEVGVYIPAGVYIISATLTIPSSESAPNFIFGDQIDVSVLLAQNPAIAAYTPMAVWQTVGSLGLFNFSFAGGSWSRAGSPSAGTLVTIQSFVSTMENCSVINSSFLQGFLVQNASGTISGFVDCAQSEYDVDATTLLGCQAGGFLFGPGGGEGGTAFNCSAVGDWPLTYCYDFNSDSEANEPVTLIGCGASGGALSTVIPVGFHLNDRMSAFDCNATGLQTGFVIGQSGRADHCFGQTTSGTGNTLADFVVSNGELPYAPLKQYFLNQLIIDSNGNYQQVTTPGTTGASTPIWATVNGNTTTDGSVVWTKLANPGYTQIKNASVRLCDNSTSGALYALYDIGLRSTLEQNNFVGLLVSADPAQVVVSGIQTVTANYPTVISDDMVNVNTTANVTITLTTTGILAGKSYTVKNISTGVVTVAGQTGNIDKQANIQIPLTMMSLDFKWDGTNFWIH